MNNPYQNLATEEYLLKELDCSTDDYIFIYRNEPAVIVGRNQNIYEEIDLKYCLENNIAVCRRISGGGTVYHDLGNINIAIISACNTSKVNNYSYFMTELFAFLKSKGIDVYLNSRNSIYKNDKKIGGNAQFTNRKNIISHCTLLFSSDLVQLNRSIESPFKLIESKASKSVRSDVVNLSEFISEDTAESLHSDLMEYYRLQPNKKVINLDRNQQNQIENDYVAKMKSFDWVYGRSPKCELYVNHEQFSIQHGKISTCTVEGLVQLPFLPSAELIRYF